MNAADRAALIVRISASYEQLKAQLAGAGQVIQTTTKSMEKLSTSLQGGPAISQAAKITAVIQGMGGASMLTERQAQQMLRQMSAGFEILQKSAGGVPPEIAKMHAELSAMTSKVSAQTPVVGALHGQWAKLTSAFAAGALLERGIAAVADGFRLAVQFVGDSIKEFMAAEKVQRQLTAALHAQGLAIPSVIDHFDELAEKYSKLTVHSGGAIREIQALLLQVGGVLPSEMDKALDAVTNLSAGLGIDLQAAASMVAKSFEDQFGALKKAGIQIDETRAKAEGMTYVLDQIRQRFGGQARSEMESYAGQLEQIKNQWADFKEEVGRTLSDAGVLSTGLALAKVGVRLLTLEFMQLISMMNTMPSLDSVAKFGIGTSAVVWRKQQAAEFQRMVAEMNGRQNGGGAAGSDVISNEEALLVLRRKLDSDEAERLKKAAKSAETAAKAYAQLEERFQSWKRATLGMSDARREQFAFEQRLIKEGLMPQIPAMAKIEDQTLRLIRVTDQHTASIKKQFEAARQAADRVSDATGKNLVSPISYDVIFKGAKKFSDLMAQTNTFDEAGLKRFNGQLGVASTLINAVGRSAQGAFGTVMQWASSATAAIFKYAGSLKTAADASQFAMSAATMGIDFAVQSIFSINAAFEAFYAQTRALREELTELGVLATSLTDLGLPDHGWQLADAGNKEQEALRALIKATKELNSQFSSLTSLAQKFGGVVPVSLRPAIAELLKMNGLTADMRRQLEGLAGEPSWQVMEQRARDLGIDFAALGSSFNQDRIKDIAFGYLHDLELFKNGDMDGILRGMADEFSKLAMEAARTGSALPEQLRGTIDRLRAMGLLLDENGQAIGELTFREMEDDALIAMRDLLTDIRDLLAQAFPQAAQAAADGINRAFARVRPPSLNPGWGGFGNIGGDNQYLHGGPAGATAGGGSFSFTIPVSIDGREVGRASARFVAEEARFLVEA